MPVTPGGDSGNESGLAAGYVRNHSDVYGVGRIRIENAQTGAIVVTEWRVRLLHAGTRTVKRAGRGARRDTSWRSTQRSG